MRPVNAFLIVDVQNDFISGSLDISNCSAQQKGHEVSFLHAFGVDDVLSFSGFLFFFLL